MNETTASQQVLKEYRDHLLKRQAADGAWRMCFESGTITEAFMIIVMRSLGIEGEAYIKGWCERILDRQQKDGAWRLYSDEAEGNLAATVECYYALLYSNYYHRTDEPLARAEAFILSKGGLSAVNSLLTKVLLAVTGQYPWPRSLQLPITFLLLPDEAPVSFFDFVGYSRVHIAPVLVLADQEYVLRPDTAPDLSHLLVKNSFLTKPTHRASSEASVRADSLLKQIHDHLQKITEYPEKLHKQALQEAEQFMLARIEEDGTLYSYGSATFLMMFACKALGYETEHPVLQRALHGLIAQMQSCGSHPHLQNCTSTVWDTALISCALQEAGVAPEHPAIGKAADYLLNRQHHKLGDWYLRNPNPFAGGWGFSESNTINPDVDDTSAALRALHPFKHLAPYKEAWNRGLHWLLTMQNEDGGWPAFEKNTDLPLLTWLPLDNAADATIDPSSSDLTGRALEFLGRYAGLQIKHPFLRKAADWLIGHQEDDGSWYGRWGICYIYGTWAALTGLSAVGIKPDHTAIRKAAGWLLDIQRPDGSWGESCRSDVVKRYVALPFGTPSQTAWALDALIAVHDRPTPELKKGLHALVRLMEQDSHTEAAAYPTGAGLPGLFYTRYHSYHYLWPLLTVAHYHRKYS